EVGGEQRLAPEVFREAHVKPFVRNSITRRGAPRRQRHPLDIAPYDRSFSGHSASDSGEEGPSSHHGAEWALWARHASSEAQGVRSHSGQTIRQSLKKTLNQTATRLHSLM